MFLRTPLASVPQRSRDGHNSPGPMLLSSNFLRNGILLDLNQKIIASQHLQTPQCDDDHRCQERLMVYSFLCLLS